jgi:hypothetical protein
LLSNFGLTSTEANEVCLLLLASKGEILTSLCTPFSDFNKPKAFSPFTSKATLLMPASSPAK